MPHGKPNAINKRIGERIQQRRDDYGFAIGQLVGVVGVSWQQTREYAIGSSDMSVSRLGKIADQLQ